MGEQNPLLKIDKERFMEGGGRQFQPQFPRRGRFFYYFYQLPTEIRNKS
jgi:hypothetical protein